MTVLERLDEIQRLAKEEIARLDRDWDDIRALTLLAIVEHTKRLRRTIQG
jgi:hypothetical protein